MVASRAKQGLLDSVVCLRGRAGCVCRVALGGTCVGRWCCGIPCHAARASTSHRASRVTLHTPLIPIHAHPHPASYSPIALPLPLPALCSLASRAQPLPHPHHHITTHPHTDIHTYSSSILYYPASQQAISILAWHTLLSHRSSDLPLPSVYLRDRDIEQSNTTTSSNNSNTNDDTNHDIINARAEEASFLKLALA